MKRCQFVAEGLQAAAKGNVRLAVRLWRPKRGYGRQKRFRRSDPDNTGPVRAVFVVKGRTTATEMAYHDLPWPKRILHDLREASVELRETLSYFIEPV
jgi:hypothetical protein